MPSAAIDTDERELARAVARGRRADNGTHAEAAPKPMRASARMVFIAGRELSRGLGRMAGAECRRAAAASRGEQAGRCVSKSCQNKRLGYRACLVVGPGPKRTQPFVYRTNSVTGLRWSTCPPAAAAEEAVSTDRLVTRKSGDWVGYGTHDSRCFCQERRPTSAGGGDGAPGQRGHDDRARKVN